MKVSIIVILFVINVLPISCLSDHENMKYLLCKEICISRVEHGGMKINSILDLISKKSEKKMEKEDLEDKLAAIMITNCYNSIDDAGIKEATKDIKKVANKEEFPDKELYAKYYNLALIEEYFNNNNTEKINYLENTYYNISYEYKKFQIEGGFENNVPLDQRKGRIGIFGIDLIFLDKIKIIFTVLLICGIIFGIVYFIFRIKNKNKKSKKQSKKNK